MKEFNEIVKDLHKLTGVQLSSLSGQAKKITVTEVNEDERRVCLSVEDGSTDSRSFEEFEKITNALRENVFVHVIVFLEAAVPAEIGLRLLWPVFLTLNVRSMKGRNAWYMSVKIPMKLEP